MELSDLDFSGTAGLLPTPCRATLSKAAVESEFQKKSKSSILESKRIIRESKWEIGVVFYAKPLDPEVTLAFLIPKATSER